MRRGARRRAGRRRGHGRVCVTRVALDTPRVGPDARPSSEGPHPPRRTIERLLRVGDREDDGPTGDRGDHERHCRRRAPAGRRRGLAVADAARPPHGGPPAEGARHGSEPDDRAARTVRGLRAGLDRPPRPGDTRSGSVVAPGHPRGVRGDGRRPPGTGAPELPVRGAALPLGEPDPAGGERRTVRVAAPTGGRARSRRDRSAGRSGVRRARNDRGRRVARGHIGRHALLVGRAGVAGPGGADIDSPPTAPLTRGGAGVDREHLGRGPSS
jgi:hypothetical protein